MAPEPDPYRTLELTDGASIAEVRRAYRRLAKVHHPDAAGEQSLPRFLAIQAAYEQLIGGADAPTGRRRTPPAPRRPWEADPDRSDATRRAYGGRARSAPPGGSDSTGATGAAGPGAGRQERAGSARPGRRRRSEPREEAGQRPGDPSPGATDGPPNKATLGSTSYDGADATPFEPDWGGASWYGTTSGTYWTLNPKEYADPRKHGPEYQARARRATRASESRGAGAAAAPDPVDPDPAVGPTHTTSSWWESTAGGRPAATDASESPAPAHDHAPATPAPVPPPDLERAATEIGRALRDDQAGGMRGRVVRAIVGWLPIAFGVGWLVGELTGCGRFAASCDGIADPFVLMLQAAVLAVLVLVPAVASVVATASIAVLVAAGAAAVILSASGGAADGPSRESALGAVLLVAWLVGVVVAIVRRARAPSTPARPVS